MRADRQDRGQATEPDTQDDCPQYDRFGRSVDLSGSLQSNPNFGQMTSAAGLPT